MTNDGSPTQGDAVEESGSAGLGGYGWMLLLIGAGISIFAFVMPVSVDTAGAYGLPADIANIDKIAIRHMVHLGGLAAMLAGVVMICAGQITKAIRSR